MLTATYSLYLPHRTTEGRPQDTRSRLDVRTDVRNLLYYFNADIHAEVIGYSIHATVWVFTMPTSAHTDRSFRERLSYYLAAYGIESATLLSSNSSLQPTVLPA